MISVRPALLLSLLAGTIAAIAILGLNSHVVEHWKQLHMSSMIDNAILLVQFSSISSSSPPSRRLIRIDDFQNGTDTESSSSSLSTSSSDILSPPSSSRPLRPTPIPTRGKVLAPSPLPSEHRCHYTDNTLYDPHSPQCKNGMPTIPEYLLPKHSVLEQQASTNSGVGGGEVATTVAAGSEVSVAVPTNQNGHGSSSSSSQDRKMKEEQQPHSIPRKTIPEFRRHVSTPRATTMVERKLHFWGRRRPAYGRRHNGHGLGRSYHRRWIPSPRHRTFPKSRHGMVPK